MVKSLVPDFWARHADLVSLQRDLRYNGYARLNLKHFDKLKKEVDAALKALEETPENKRPSIIEWIIRI